MCNLTAITRVIYFAGSVLFGVSAEAEERTLCQPHEEVYFSCETEGKVISVCASGNISPDNGTSNIDSG